MNKKTETKSLLINDKNVITAKQTLNKDLRKAILTSPPGTGLHRMVELISLSFTMPYALITLHNRQNFWFQTSFGLEQAQTANIQTVIKQLDMSSSNILLTEHQLNECLLEYQPLRFGILMPIIGFQGVPIGYIALFDNQQHSNFLERQLQLLVYFAGLVGEYVETIHQTVTQTATTNQQQEKFQNYNLPFTAAVLDSVEYGIVACDIKGKLELINQTARQLYGIQGSDPLDCNWRDSLKFFQSDGKTPLNEEDNPLQNALSGTWSESSEIIIESASGERRLIQTRGHTLHNKVGHKLGSLVSLHDKTIQAAAEQKYRKMYNLTPALMHSIDNNGYVLSVSDFWLKTMGFNRAEVVGHLLTEFMSESSRRKAISIHFPAIMRDGGCKNVYLKFLKHDGESMEVLLSAIADRDTQGNILKSALVMVDITENIRLEEAVNQSEREFKGAFDAGLHSMALVSITGQFLKVNQSLCDLFGYSQAELLQLNVKILVHPEDLDNNPDYLDQLLAGSINSYQTEKRFLAKHDPDNYIWGNLSLVLVRDSDGDPLHIVLQIVDLTRQKEEEARALQSQKLDAVGQLSGGLAHDFNNLLAVIIGNLELMERSPLLDEKLTRRLKAAMRAAQSGADLTGRLLAFSGKQLLHPKLINANEFLTKVYELAHRTLGKEIDLKVVTCDSLWLTLVDPSQLEAAVLNLSLNARDAMLNGGQLTITASNASLDKFYAAKNPDVAVGDYVKISVSDRGTGMNQATIKHVFEPFFSTKAIGKGGLGLTMVWNFVKQIRGHIKVYSELGVGTTVNLYLPRNQDTSLHEVFDPNTEYDDTDDNIVGGNETILVVDDDEEVKEVVVELLTELGYNIFQAGSGTEGLAVLAINPQIQMLLTDIVMPGGMNGIELAELALQLHPNLKVLHSSGFATDAIIRAEEMASVKHLLSKPYSKRTLARHVRLVLEAEN